MSCQALNVSDGQRCIKDAQDNQGLFCHFHSRQCYGLYKGYKRRNAELDHLIDNPPPVLQGKQLHALQVSSIDKEDALQELYEHLFHRYVLLDRVIRARKLHHSRFYSLELDYGHENFINQLSASKTPLLRALEDVSQRIAEVRHKQQKWFSWIRDLEDEEEQQRDAEKKKVKQEAALFQRHAKELERQRRLFRTKEEQKRQQDYLEKAWTEQIFSKLRGTNAQSVEEDAMWDPVEDSVEDERALYIELLRHFLWKSTSQPEETTTSDDKQDVQQSHNDDLPMTPSETSILPTGTKSENAKKKARQKAKAKNARNPQTETAPTLEKNHVESLEQMRDRLKHPEQYIGAHLVTYDGQTKTREEHKTMFTLSDDEIEKLLKDISEVKELLFCRLLLSRASLLPAALKAGTVEEFLSNTDVTNTELRDLCLRLEQPSLQEIRDACADLGRHEDEHEEETDEGEKPLKKGKSLFPRLKRAIPSSMQTKREKAIKKKRETTKVDVGGTFVDFGSIDDEGQFKVKRISVKVCGKNIYNYPSEKAMSRGGWLQFSVLAKDCTANDAVSLCRSWDEFYELITLIRWTYFPSVRWMSLIGNQSRRQLMNLTFMPYFQVEAADQVDHKHQSSRSDGPRRHSVLESRNFICGIMKRNDPLTRRFIQYVAMRSSSMVILVRDVSTGEVLVQPPDEELWLVRSKIGMGRLSRGEWKIDRSVDEEFFEKMDVLKKWSLSFKDYYDIIIWDYKSGSHFSELFNDIQVCLFKAVRYRHSRDLYQPTRYILETIVWDADGMRSRDAREGEETLWDQVSGPNVRTVSLDQYENGELGPIGELPESWQYNEADRLEDEVLFPGDPLAQGDLNSTTATASALLAVQSKKLHKFEADGVDMKRFVLDLDTDDEMSDSEMEEDIANLIDGDDNDATNEPVSDDGDSEWEDEHDVMLDLEDELFGTPNREDDALAQEVWQIYVDWMATALAEEEPPNPTLTQAQQRRRARELRAEMREIQQEQMRNDFELFLDRTRAATFKDCWHNSDLEPNAQQNWAEFQIIFTEWIEWRISQALPAIRYGRMKQVWMLVTALRLDPLSHNRVVRDMWDACDMVDLFSGQTGTFLHTEVGMPFQKSLLLNKKQRAEQVPDRRTSHSCRTRPKEQWKQWDALKKSHNNRWTEDLSPEQWNLITRPIIAFLYREGVICTDYSAGSAGYSVCLEEPTRPGKPDLFFDWRHQIPEMTMPSSFVDPLQLTPLPEQAKRYAQKHPSAKFSVLKIWSAPHFWPLMLGHDNRGTKSFIDGIGRTWCWKFIPKDMPYSEWSIHRTVHMRLAEFDEFFNPEAGSKDCKIVHRKDMMLVMTKNVETCRWLSTAAVYAVQTRPWRLEIDPWKSWFNVDIDFIDSLQTEWWD